MLVKEEIINRNKTGIPNTIQSVGYNHNNYVQKGILYALIYVVLSAIVSFIFGVQIIPGATTIKAVLIPAIAYVVIGMLFATLLYSRLNYLSKLNINGGLQYAFIVFIGVFLVSLLIGIIKKNGIDTIVSSLFYSILFILPFIIYQTWLFYNSLITDIQKKAWYLPEVTSHVPVATVFLNSLRIKIKIAPTQGAAEQVFETTVPGRLNLGNMFSNFIYDKESRNKEGIDLEDEDNHLYGWKFLTPAFLGIGKRQIDANLSLNENHLKNSSVIIARRVKNDRMN